MTTKNASDHEQNISFKMHPRVFAALGADLVTNDVVAVIELVKNSYDAFASNAWIRFLIDDKKKPYIEIEDDGTGMTQDVIDNVWCLVATPFKEKNPFVRRGNKKRRVSGEKGLGRLSVARLGDRLKMLTQAPGSACWEVDVDWTDLSESDDLSSCFARRRKYAEESPFDGSGTVLQIHGLKGAWDENRIADLEDNLARLISPFEGVQDFHVYLNRPGTTEAEAVRIESPEFLSKPKYLIKGDVDAAGTVSAKYSFSPVQGGKGRTKSVKHTWEQTFDSIQDPAREPFDPQKPHCGPFSFEIRAWDIAPEDTQEIAEHFAFEKGKVRKAIKSHKGLSVYRDGILVLPKSDVGRDWLGLDLRRVSKVGTRLSTSQIVGYVGVSADKNPDIEDTSDRERLASGLAVAEFEEQLKAIVALLENERDEDRVKHERRPPLENLFNAISAEKLSAEVQELAREGADADETLPAIREHQKVIDDARKELQERFVYYSRLATVGTIAQMIVHEIRNRTTAIGSFLSFAQDRFGPFNEKDASVEYGGAKDSIASLERLADTFSPLASRGYRRRLRHSILEERIRATHELLRGEFERKKISFPQVPGNTKVAIDPGELDAVLLNLLSNSAYWLGQNEVGDRKLVVVLSDAGLKGRIAVEVHDNGPGVPQGDEDKIFTPGYTKKINGIGMGLTVASEIIAGYGGQLGYRRSPKLKGACFRFDVPLN